MNSSVIAGEKPRINSIKTQPTSKRDYTQIDFQDQAPATFADCANMGTARLSLFN